MDVNCTNPKCFVLEYSSRYTFGFDRAVVTELNKY